MAKIFNVTGCCIPEEHYMVDLSSRLESMKILIASRQYFTMNRARQYGKTTILFALEQYLKKSYYVVLLDFQTFSAGEFENENIFALSFARSFLRALKRNNNIPAAVLDSLQKIVQNEPTSFRLQRLFEELSEICGMLYPRIVLMIDEVDSAANYQVFVDFLAQLRAYYIRRNIYPTFQSVILAGVYDVKNLKSKIRKDKEHQGTSPWNIAIDLNMDLSFSIDDIYGMLAAYEADSHTGMNLEDISKILYDYTAGYPYLVSGLCKLIDEEICKTKQFVDKKQAWTPAGLREAVRVMLAQKNTLFTSLIDKLTMYTELNTMLKTLLFTGRNIVYNCDDPSIDIATMFGFIKNQEGSAVVANRIFETRLYNFYLSASELQKLDIYKASLEDKNQFLIEGHLNMKRVLEKFVVHFNDLYGGCERTFLEDEGRKYFLLYLRPIINGTGNYYIEAQTRSLGRTDVIVDYQGEQFVIEMKIWHGNEYYQRGEQQLVEYLNDYYLKKGYMVSFCFNKKKQIGVREIVVGDKVLVEAIV